MSGKLGFNYSKWHIKFDPYMNALDIDFILYITTEGPIKIYMYYLCY